MIGDIKFVKIPSGSFIMGSHEGEGENDEHPQHTVTLESFWMSIYPVTQKQYLDVMKQNSSHYKGIDRPVELVTWNDAMAFCEAFSKKYKVKVRLPYEAEYEYACRAGTTTKYYWGNSINGDYCWYRSNSGFQSHPVGQKKPNAWGLYDMSGNVWSWCMDYYDRNYYSNSPSKNLKGASIKKRLWQVLQSVFGVNRRVLRGGSWDDDGYGVRSAYRFNSAPGSSSGDSGFRLVLSSR